MKRLFNYLQINGYFTLFIFIVSYILVIESRVKSSLSVFQIFQPDAPIGQFFTAMLMILVIRVTIDKLGKQQEANTIRTYIKYFIASFIIYLAISNLFGLLIAAAFGTIERNFNSYTLINVNISKSVQFILFGSIYLVYLYAKENKNYREKITGYDEALSASKIEQLKAQLNPHFLFNNLNTLDQLIEEDQHKASDFLNHFSELYRYSLRTTGKKLVSILEEIEFVTSYFKLMEHKYAGYYTLDIRQSGMQEDGQVPPFCLQVLVENAIEHNLGTKANPVNIKINISDNIEVSNNRIAKQYKRKTNGVALKNLTSQYQLLGAMNISISETDDHFMVTLPIITNHQYA